MQGLMEVFRGLPGPGLDLILHSPGGDPDAAASLVRYMRSKYSDVRVFVPLAAMSAATMWALAADRIVMGKHSQLGPIDPQLILPQAGIMVPAGSLIRQFDRAVAETREDPARLNAWLPTLQQYFPGLLEMCEDADTLSRSLVREWLGRWMLAGHPEPDRSTTAEAIVTFFADRSHQPSHSLGIDRDKARTVGVVVEDLEDDPALQDAVLSAHHAAMHTLSATPTVKLLENHLGRAFVLQESQMQVQVPFPVQGPVQGPPALSVTGSGR
jgi:hypothetical protein